MKKIAIFILLFSQLSVNAENVLDSLSLIWQDESIADSLRIKAARQYASRIATFDTNKTLIDLQNYSNFSKAKGAAYDHALAEFMLGQTLMDEEEYGKALWSLHQSMDLFDSLGMAQKTAQTLVPIGHIYSQKEDYQRALAYYQQSLELNKKTDDLIGISQSKYLLGFLYQKMGKVEKGLSLCHEAYQTSLQTDSFEIQRSACICLYKGYKQLGEWEKAREFLDKSFLLVDSLVAHSQEWKMNQFFYQFEYEKFVEIDQEHIQSEKKVRSLWFIALLITITLAITYLFYRENRTKQYLLEEIRRKDSTITETQDLLMEKEKLASLGQMTIGITHEIKNPLNFVINFAEGAKEVLEEFEEDFEDYSGKNNQEAYDYLKESLKMLYNNNRDIISNGHRLNNIVDGMIAHAEGRPGEKAEVKMNHLLGIQANLAIKGRKGYVAGKKVNVETKFDDSLPAVMANPQELSQVFLNLMNNALYALEKKGQMLKNDFQPSMRLETEVIGGQIIVKIRDNGMGIPDHIRHRIFEPFVTSKPHGDGNTGLGLAICSDIIQKRLNGNLCFTSVEGEFTEFVVSIPIT